jgi:hypothetical protein
VLLRNGQHAARAAGGIVDGEMFLRDGNIQQLDHQADDFARREVLSSFVTVLFRKAPEQLLIDGAPLQTGELIGTSRLFFTINPMVAR